MTKRYRVKLTHYLSTPYKATITVTVDDDASEEEIIQEAMWSMKDEDWHIPKYAHVYDATLAGDPDHPDVIDIQELKR